MDELTEHINYLFDAYRNNCVGSKTVPFAVLSTTEKGDLRVYFDPELSVNDLIHTLDGLADYLEEMEKKAEGN